MNVRLHRRATSRRPTLLNGRQDDAAKGDAYAAPSSAEPAASRPSGRPRRLSCPVGAIDAIGASFRTCNCHSVHNSITSAVSDAPSNQTKYLLVFFSFFLPLWTAWHRRSNRLRFALFVCPVSIVVPKKDQSIDPSMFNQVRERAQTISDQSEKETALAPGYQKNPL